MATGLRLTCSVRANNLGSGTVWTSQMFDAEYTATYFPFRETLKSKLSGSAEELAEFDTSSSSVRLGCACDVVVVGLLEALGRRSSSVMFDVMAVE
jgi:hypothetical protein